MVIVIGISGQYSVVVIGSLSRLNCHCHRPSGRYCSWRPRLSNLAFWLCLWLSKPVFRRCLLLSKLVFCRCLRLSKPVFRRCILLSKLVFRRCLRLSKPVFRRRLWFSRPVSRRFLRFSKLVFRQFLGLFRPVLVLVFGSKPVFRLSPQLNSRYSCQLPAQQPILVSIFGSIAGPCSNYRFNSRHLPLSLAQQAVLTSTISSTANVLIFVGYRSQNFSCLCPSEAEIIQPSTFLGGTCKSHGSLGLYSLVLRLSKPGLNFFTAF